LCNAPATLRALIRGARLDLSPVREVLIEESLVGWKNRDGSHGATGWTTASLFVRLENFDANGRAYRRLISARAGATLTDKDTKMDARRRVLQSFVIGVRDADRYFSLPSS